MDSEHTPVRFDLHEAINGTLRRMHHINRFSSMPVIKPENVAAHSYQAAMIGLLICMDLKRHRRVDTEQVVTALLLHDISECMSGDIIRTYKHGSEAMREACESADYHNTYALTRELGDAVGDEVILHWRTAKEEGLEGDIVRLADAMCVVAYCVDEWHMGNSRLDLVLRQCYETIIKPLMARNLILVKYIKQVFPNDNYVDAYRVPPRSLERAVTWQSPSR